MATGPQTQRGSGAAPASGERYDILVIFLVLVAAAVPYVHGLRFYSDDWAFIGEFSTAADKSLPGLLNVIRPHTGVRPVQALYLAALYWLFGMNHLGYHVVNHAVFVIAIVLLYRCLRLLALPRFLCFAWSVVFGLLPHYSTDRFWYAAFQANLSLCLYLVSTLADLRAASAGRPRFAVWKIISAAAMAMSLLAYEVVAPLFLVNLLLVGYRVRLQRQQSPARRVMAWWLSPAVSLVILCVIAAYKLVATDRLALHSSFSDHVRWLAAESFSNNYIGYGLELPAKTVRVLTHYADGALIACGVLLGALVAYCLLRMTGANALSRIGAKLWTAACLSGVILTAAGYASFLTTDHIEFTETGIANRTAIAGSLGIALTFVSAIGLACSFIGAGLLRRVAFCMAVAFLCTAGFLINNAIARSWVEAAKRQEHVIRAVRAKFPSLPRNTTLILDGFCPYVGAGVVFETTWDVSGMLYVLYGDRTLLGDVFTEKMTPGEQGLSTTIYNQRLEYRYSDKLVVYHTGQNYAHRLSSREEALRYTGLDFRGSIRCPPGREGQGVNLF